MWDGLRPIRIDLFRVEAGPEAGGVLVTLVIFVAFNTDQAI